MYQYMYFVLYRYMLWVGGVSPTDQAYVAGRSWARLRRGFAFGSHSMKCARRHCPRSRAPCAVLRSFIALFCTA